MKIILIVLGYLKWHYGKSIISLSAIWKNFFFFLAEFFSIRLLIRNFFDPWKRMSDRYPQSLILKEYFYAFINNLIMRVTGMLLRGLLLIISLISISLLIILYPVILIIWLVLPFIVIALISIGLLLILR